MNDELVRELVHEQLKLIKVVQAELKQELTSGKSPQAIAYYQKMLTELTQQLAHLNTVPGEPAPKKAGRPKKEPVIQTPPAPIIQPPPDLPTPTTYSWGNVDSSHYQ